MAPVAVGTTVGRLTVLDVYMDYMGIRPLKKALCRCECGVVKTYIWGNIRNGKSASCGCYKKDVSNRRFGTSRQPVEIGKCYNNMTITGIVEGSAPLKAMFSAIVVT